MNAYLSDSIAREHADRLMADARAARRARSIRASRRAAGRRTQSSATHDAGTSARFVTRPFTALHDWLVAGEM